MLCNNANAAIYCYNDNAYLCKACDGQIHNKNKLAWRHQRSHLCEVCDSAPPKPAVVYCAQDKVRARALCFTAVNVTTALARPRSEIHQRRDETKTARESVFVARASSAVGRRPRRDRPFPRRYTRRALSRRTNAPRLADRHVPPFHLTSARVRAVRRRLRSRPTRQRRLF